MPKHYKNSKHMKGKGIIEDIRDRPISTIASYALPTILGATGGTAGSELGLVVAGPVGATLGGVAGSALGSFAGKKVAEDLRRKGLGYSNKRSMLGGAMMNNPDLSGYTISQNGTYQPVAPRMSGRGQTSAFGTISSEFGKILI